MRCKLDPKAGEEDGDADIDDCMLNEYPDDLDSTPEDFAIYMFRVADCKALAEVLKKGPLKVGSLCTGVGTCFMVFGAMCKIWNATKAKEFGVIWTCEHVFAVEQDLKKRELLIKHMTFVHVFENAEDFATGNAFDYKTQATVNTFSLDVDIIIAGLREPSPQSIACTTGPTATQLRNHR